jgi:hypothetical protein
MYSPMSAQSQPSPRWTHSMCYDTQNNTVLLFGGSNMTGCLGDLWSYSRGKWTKLSDSGPAPRQKFAFAYDELRKCAVVFGGSGNEENLLSDTWEWNGKSWKKIDAAGPLPRDHPMAAFDRQSKTIILRGGFGQSGLLTDTWSFNGAKWTQLIGAGTAGQGLTHGMFVDESTQRLTEITIVSNNGLQHLTNTWWTLNNGIWQSTDSEFPSTSPQSLQAITAFGKGGILIFDGDDIENGVPTTWTFTAGKWISAHLAGPTPRIGHAMVWDPAEEAVILFGGYDRKNFFGDTWMWSDGRWEKL